jgi:hypothetical protein
VADQAPELKLSDLLRLVREEIDAARAHLQQTGGDALLNLHRVQIEAEFEVTRGAGGGFSLTVPFVGLGAKAKKETSVTHKVTLELSAGDIPTAGG